MNEIRVSEDEDELEAADFMVCAPASQAAVFTDDKFAFCCRCDVKVRHRPHVPVAPKKICLACAQAEMASEASKGELQVTISEKTARELQQHLIRKKQ